MKRERYIERCGYTSVQNGHPYFYKGLYIEDVFNECVKFDDVDSIKEKVIIERIIND